MSRWIHPGLLLAALAAGCQSREPPTQTTPPASVPPPLALSATASAAAPGTAPAEPRPAPADAGGADGGAPAQVGEPRTTEYSWMSVASWKEKHAALVKRAKAGQLDLLFLGDSITEGWMDNADVWQRHYGRRNAACFGIGGDTAENLLFRMQDGELEGIAPRVVVLLIGTNNLGLKKDGADAVARKVTAVVAALRAKLPAAKVLLLAVFPRGALPGAELRAPIAKVNEQLARLDDGKTVRFLDLGPRLMNPNRSISKEVMPDFLHLSDKGYEIWAEAMEPLLAEMMRK